LACSSASTVSTVVPVCGDADGDALAVEQGGAGEHDVGVGPGVGVAADAVQLLLEVLGHEVARADAVDVDPAGARHRRDDLAERRQVELGRGVLDRAGVGEGDLLDDLREVVATQDVAPDVAQTGRRGAARLGGETQPQLGIAGQPDGLAEPDDGRFGRAGELREVADGSCRGADRIGEHDVGHLALRGCQRGHQGTDADDETGQLLARHAGPSEDARAPASVMATPPRYSAFRRPRSQVCVTFTQGPSERAAAPMRGLPGPGLG